MNLVQLVHSKSSLEKISLFPQQTTVTTVYLDGIREWPIEANFRLTMYLTYLSQGSLALKREPWKERFTASSLKTSHNSRCNQKSPFQSSNKSRICTTYVGCTMHHVLCVLVVSQPRIELTLPIKVPTTSKGPLGQLPGRDISILTSSSIVTQPSFPWPKHALQTHTHTHTRRTTYALTHSHAFRRTWALFRLPSTERPVLEAPSRFEIRETGTGTGTGTGKKEGS